MAPVALAVCFLFIATLLWLDSKHERGSSRSLWLVLSWMFIAGSRSPSTWLNMRPGFEDAQSYSDGSPVDAAVYLLHIVAAFLVLAQRRIDWQRLLSNNALIALYLGFCLLSVTWADESFVAFKRWFKDMGGPLMALIVLTDKDPGRAIGCVLRRLAFIAIPLSYVLIDHVPWIGRAYTRLGTQMYTGVGMQKNHLGQLCMLAGLYFAWLLLLRREQWREMSLSLRAGCLVVLACALYLLRLTDSQTSAVCLGLALVVFLGSRLSVISSRPGRLLWLVAGSALAVGLFEKTFDVSDQIYALLGRSPTLTNRTEIWQVVLSLQTDALKGVGYLSFWSGERIIQVMNLLGARATQAHNGYIEQYLNLGAVGVALMVLLLTAGLASASRHAVTQPAMGHLRLCLLLVAVLYNYTEASFYGISNMWLLTVFALLNPARVPVPEPEQALERPSPNGETIAPQGRQVA